MLPQGRGLVFARRRGLRPQPRLPYTFVEPGKFRVRTELQAPRCDPFVRPGDEACIEQPLHEQDESIEGVGEVIGGEGRLQPAQVGPSLPSGLEATHGFGGQRSASVAQGLVSKGDKAHGVLPHQVKGLAFLLGTLLALEDPSPLEEGAGLACGEVLHDEGHQHHGHPDSEGREGPGLNVDAESLQKVHDCLKNATGSAHARPTSHRSACDQPFGGEFVWPAVGPVGLAADPLSPARQKSLPGPGKAGLRC